MRIQKNKSITKTKLAKAYLEWLYGLVNDENKSYSRLCLELFNKAFVWSVANDDNRCEDGIRLRDFFLDEKGIRGNVQEARILLEESCSVLEVIIGLARRMELLMDDLDIDTDRTYIWFQEMLKNLRLSRFRDERTDPATGRFDPIDEAEIDNILENLINRTYSYDGKGSLFPLKNHPKKDRTTVEIWYQMMDYLAENSD